MITTLQTNKQRCSTRSRRSLVNILEIIYIIWNNYFFNTKEASPLTQQNRENAWVCLGNAENKMKHTKYTNIIIIKSSN